MKPSSHCDQVLQLAVKANESSLEKLSDYRVEDNDSVISLLPPMKEKYGGSTFVSDAQNGARFGVLAEAIGWRGNMYDVFVLDEKASPEAFGKTDRNEHQRNNDLPIWEGWTSPLILKSRQSGKIWYLQVGHGWNAADDWRTYSLGDKQIKPRCIVSFGMKDGLSAAGMPQAFEKWLLALDGTLGRGENEGTLNSTAYRRVTVRNRVSTALLRPWAVPGVSSEMIAFDRNGLKEWSRSAPSFRAHYRRLKLLELQAVATLKQYYKTHFGMDTKAAKIQSRFVADSLLAAHYLFAGSNTLSERPAPPNPWPSKLPRKLTISPAPRNPT